MIVTIESRLNVFVLFIYMTRKPISLSIKTFNSFTSIGLKHIKKILLLSLITFFVQAASDQPKLDDQPKPDIKTIKENIEANSGVNSRTKLFFVGQKS